MADNVYSKTEVVGSSETSIDEAIRGAVRRAKLYYIRDKVGKKARVKKAR